MQKDSTAASQPAEQPHAHAACEGHGEAAQKVRLTAARRTVLDILCAEARPLGAYELIDRVAARTGKRPAPISVYRVLDFLVEHGLAHRLSSRNAFMACSHNHTAGAPSLFLICDTCGAVREASSQAIGRDIEELAAETGFSRRSQVIEITGVCRDCAGPRAAAGA